MSSSEARPILDIHELVIVRSLMYPTGWERLLILETVPRLGIPVPGFWMQIPSVVVGLSVG